MGMWVGRGRKARVAYGFDDIALVPGTVTINPNEVDISWELCGHHFELPIIAAAMDGVVSPGLAIEMGRLGGLAVLNLEGIFSRYANPEDVLDRIVSASQEEATKIIQSIYGEPIKEELIHQRIRAIKKGGGPAVVSSIPQRAERFAQIAQEAGADIFVVQSTVTTARHIATEYTPVDFRKLKKQLAIPLIIGNVVTYEACLELIDCGADALLIGVGPGAACTSREVLGLGVPQVTATADAAAARDYHYKQKGRYVPIVTDGGMTTGGDACKALAAGADAVLDFGGQYTQLIARRVREMSVYSEIFSCTHPIESILAGGYKGIILSGGPSSVYEDGAPLPPKALFDAGIPLLGICYGMQAMGYLLGGHVVPAERREYGKADVELRGSSRLLRGVEPDADGRVAVWMSHGDTVLRPPKGFTALGATPNCPVAAMADEERNLYAVQFHPEVVHTPQGRKIFDNFLDICGVGRTWSMAGFIDTTVEEIREQVGRQRVLCALSGGVDSSVVAVLVHRAVGDQLTCVFVDNGLLRKGEAPSVDRTFRDAFKIPLIHIDASARFLDVLRGVTDPELKRKRIGAEFIDVFEETARKQGEIPWLAQGTLYPDVIESVSSRGPSATIKTHHNVGGLPERMRFKLVEPLRELFKDEVRQVGALLRLPAEIIWRQPFPGPGLAVRVLGEVAEERLTLLREADAIVQDEVRAAGLERDLWQAFAVLLPVRTVGVMGDFRTYSHVIALRAVMSQDAMTADWARLPYELLGKISNRIINEVEGVNRVVFDISSKPPSTIEWE